MLPSKQRNEGSFQNKKEESMKHILQFEDYKKINVH